MASAAKSIISRWNGKPLLTRDEHVFHYGEHYMEIELDLHRWKYLVRKIWNTLSKGAARLPLNSGYVIEGHDNGELPEQVLGCAFITGVDVDSALPVDFGSFFARA